jgi:hypothetical protein
MWSIYCQGNARNEPGLWSNSCFLCVSLYWSECWMLDVGCRILDVGCRMLDVGCWRHRSSFPHSSRRAQSDESLTHVGIYNWKIVDEISVITDFTRHFQKIWEEHLQTKSGSRVLVRVKAEIVTWILEFTVILKKNLSQLKRKPNNKRSVLWSDKWMYARFWSIIEFIAFLQLVTTSKDDAVAVIHTSQTTIVNNRFSQSVIFIMRCLATDPLLQYPRSYRQAYLTAVHKLN